ncbi:MAG TPA: DUF1015 domain-containing protein [Abditibacteriaceae bacterium]
MAEFLPFAGLRYNTEKVTLADVMCPPYDVIKGKMRDELAQRDEHNIVRVELATYYGEDATPEQYAASAALLKQWQAEGILVHDDSAYYIYEQEFVVPGSGETKKRRGTFGALRLEEFGDTIKPHEHTLSGPKADRLNLLRAARTNTSPIFGLFDDSNGWVQSILQVVCNTTPLASAVDADGITHRVWRLTDDESVNAIEAALEKEPIFIADGHHRYETALNYRNERKAQAEAEGRTWSGEEPENWVMMICVSTSDDGLVVLPTHRVVKGVNAEDITRMIESLDDNFDVQLVATESTTEVQARQLMQAVNESSNTQPRLGIHISGQSYLVTLKNGDAHLASMDSERSAAYNALDVSVLHKLIMENKLGVGAEALAAGGHVVYTIDAAEAMNKVNNGDGQIAFLLRPTLIQQVQDVASAGDKMPQKSTYFYPKVVTGMVLRPLG